MPEVVGVLGPRVVPQEAPGDVLVSEDGNAARLAVISTSRCSTPRRSRRRRSRGAASRGSAGGGPPAGGGRPHRPDGGRLGHGRGDRRQSALVGAVVLALLRPAGTLPARPDGAALPGGRQRPLGRCHLGLTTYVFQGLLGHNDLTYYVPFAAGVLLGLGSDYNVFVAGRIWQEADRRPLREAIAVAVPRASRAISVAGIALAASFAMLAIIPIDGFREFAFMMAVGVLLETFRSARAHSRARRALRYGRGQAGRARARPRSLSAQSCTRAMSCG